MFTCVFVFLVQTTLVVLYLFSLDTHHEMLSEQVTKYWGLAILIQTLVLAGATETGSGFSSEIPFWISVRAV
jgi:hypothetical protein